MAYQRDGGGGGKRGGQRFGSKKPYGAGKSYGDRKAFGGGFGAGKPMMHSATCAECGARCQVPFRPNGSKPVLCNQCFGNDDRSGAKSYGFKRFDDKPKRYDGGDTALMNILKEINNKLDLIIRSLEG